MNARPISVPKPMVKALEKPAVSSGATLCDERRQDWNPFPSGGILNSLLPDIVEAV